MSNSNAGFWIKRGLSLTFGKSWGYLQASLIYYFPNSTRESEHASLNQRLAISDCNSILTAYPNLLAPSSLHCASSQARPDTELETWYVYRDQEAGVPNHLSQPQPANPMSDSDTQPIPFPITAPPLPSFPPPPFLTLPLPSSTYPVHRAPDTNTDNFHPNLLSSPPLYLPSSPTPKISNPLAKLRKMPLSLSPLCVVWLAHLPPQKPLPPKISPPPAKNQERKNTTLPFHTHTNVNYLYQGR